MGGSFPHLHLDRRPNGVLVVHLDRPEVGNALDDALHESLVRLWPAVADDDAVRVVVITGRGRDFCVGAELDLVEANATDPARLHASFARSTALVQNLLALDKPVISAIHGAAAGAGLAVALLADISIIAENARISDGHTRVGVAAGDHGALLWPLLCGMARARYHLLMSTWISGVEAERIGLVSLCVPEERLMRRAMAIADRLAAGPQRALHMTKRSLNLWLRQAMPLFEQSLALEMLTFLDPDVLEGVAALREGRRPRFPSASE